MKELLKHPFQFFRLCLLIFFVGYLIGSLIHIQHYLPFNIQTGLLSLIIGLLLLSILLFLYINVSVESLKKDIEQISTFPKEQIKNQKIKGISEFKQEIKSLKDQITFLKWLIPVTLIIITILIGIATMR